MYDTPPPDMTGPPCSSAEPTDLDCFWGDTLAEARAFSWDPTFDRITTRVRLVYTYDVTFAGVAGDRTKAWFHVAAGTRDVPVVVRY